MVYVVETKRQIRSVCSLFYNKKNAILELMKVTLFLNLSSYSVHTI